MKLSNQLLIIVGFIGIVSSCARKGRPQGGPKDETAPIMVIAKPPHETTNFEEKTIKIYFDEYIVLKDLNKQLVISPPLKNPPLITPQGTPSKFISIKLLDTLKPNTTYTFNFGSAVQDNNENNKLENFKYVFSTGNYIDSLTTQGTVADAISPKLKKNISVLLYEIDSTYTDSIVYKQKPSYVANTADSLNYKFTNLKQGKYYVVGLDETSTDYIFNPKTDKIGFIIDTINLPKDSIIKKPLTVFKEEQKFNFKRGKEAVKGRIEFGFEGKQTDFNVKLLSKVPDTFKAFTQLQQDKDTLNYWHTPIEADSLLFEVKNNAFLDTVTVFLRKEKIDSLAVNSNVSNVLHLNDTLFLTTNTPITKIDTTKFSLVDKDTVSVTHQIKQKSINKIAVLFEAKPKNRYTLDVLPKAITDLFEVANDSLNYKFGTKDTEDYGSITLTVDKKVESPVIIELLIKDKVVKTSYIKNSQIVTFDLLEPKEYTIRAIIDANGNNQWDTGNFLNKTQPEKIIYFDKQPQVRANWSINENFIIE
ncbi:Ig-like domain-containing protein [Tenacibaculum geojense]|uniref:Ig-like domain-containing protein n=1 Tax=Tenacibaculum geojense TaxID=915352 RepID=A0ABW3JNZ3_9FLAO